MRDEKGRGGGTYLVKRARWRVPVCNRLVSGLLLGVGCARDRIGHGSLLGMGAVHRGRLVGLAFGQVVGSGGLAGIGLRRYRSRGGRLTCWGEVWRHLRARRCGELASAAWFQIKRKMSEKSTYPVPVPKSATAVRSLGIDG